MRFRMEQPTSGWPLLADVTGSGTFSNTGGRFSCRMVFRFMSLAMVPCRVGKNAKDNN